MADLKSIGSEKLKGNAKIRRIMEIARYGEVPQNKKYHNTTLSFSKKAPDGVIYGIIQEKDGYYIKSGLNEDTLEYVSGLANKRKNRFKSYAKALKRINLMLKPINEAYNNGKGTSLFEQDDEEEKFVLKVDAPADEMGDEEMDMDMEDDMGDEEMDMDMDMEDDMGDEEMDMDMEDEEVEMEGFMKPIQKLTGKLGQKLRDVEEELGSADIKYVLNSIISAVELDNLDEEDKEDILDRFEPEEGTEYGMEDEIDIEVGDEEFEMGDEEMDMDMGDDMGDEEMDMEDEEDLLESKISKTLKKYFKVSKEEKLVEQKKIKNFIKGKVSNNTLRKNIKKDINSVEQELTIDKLIKENKINKFRGKTAQGVLYFENKNRRPVGINKKGQLVK